MKNVLILFILTFVFITPLSLAQDKEAPKEIQRVKNSYESRHKRVTNMLIKLNESYIKELEQKRDQAILREDKESVDWYNSQIDKVLEENSYLKHGIKSEEPKVTTKVLELSAKKAWHELGEFPKGTIIKVEAKGKWNIGISNPESYIDANGKHGEKDTPGEFALALKAGAQVVRVGEKGQMTIEEENETLLIGHGDTGTHDNAGSLTVKITKIEPDEVDKLE